MSGDFILFPDGCIGSDGTNDYYKCNCNWTFLFASVNSLDNKLKVNKYYNDLCNSYSAKRLRSLNY